MIPNKLRVGAHTVEVKKIDRHSHDSCGSAIPEECKIFVRDDLPPSMQFEVLVHEVLHLIRNFNGTGLKDLEVEERTVQADAHLLYQFLRDNPELLKELISLHEIQYL